MYIVTNTLLGMMILLSSISSGAKEMPCPEQTAMQAEKAVAAARDWKSLHGVYRRYRQCDDGSIAEGFTESVMRVLVDKWSTLNDFSMLAKKDKVFADFVYRHIDESAGKADLLKVLENVKTNCGVGKDVCNRIRGSAESAIKAL
jgi:hypothetical protein